MYINNADTIIGFSSADSPHCKHPDYSCQRKKMHVNWYLNYVLVKYVYPDICLSACYRDFTLNGYILYPASTLMQSHSDIKVRLQKLVCISIQSMHEHNTYKITLKKYLFYYISLFQRK